MKYAQINWNHLPVHGVGGLIFTVGIMAIFTVAFPGIALWFWLFMLIGALGGTLAYFWRNR